MSNARKTRTSQETETSPKLVKPEDGQPADQHPELLGKGRYSIYQAPNGDGVISYRPDGEDADQHQVVPAKFWGVLMGILSGQVKDLNPMELMKTLMGARK